MVTKNVEDFKTLSVREQKNVRGGVIVKPLKEYEGKNYFERQRIWQI